MKLEERHLHDLVSIGPATLRDFHLLGIRSVQQLTRKNPRKMYAELCRLTGSVHDICCLDVFTAAVAQAKNPKLPLAQCQWWYWSRKRKADPARG
jgi:Pathogenicity locus